MDVFLTRDVKFDRHKADLKIGQVTVYILADLIEKFLLISY